MENFHRFPIVPSIFIICFVTRTSPPRCFVSACNGLQQQLGGGANVFDIFDFFGPFWAENGLVYVGFSWIFHLLKCRI